MTPHAAARLRAWLHFAAGVAFIVLTLDLAYEASLFLRARGFLWDTVRICFVAAAAAVLYLLVVGARLTGARPYLRAVPALLAFGYAMMTMRSSPAERFHFLEYGILCLLALRAISYDVRGPAAYPLAFLAAAAAGWFDEWMQGLSPVRYRDPEDVVMNAVAAALATVVCAALFGRDVTRARFVHVPAPRTD